MKAEELEGNSAEAWAAAGEEEETGGESVRRVEVKTRELSLLEVEASRCCWEGAIKVPR